MLTKSLKRFFSFNVNTFNLYNKIFPPNHFPICVVGSDVPGLIISSVLPACSLIESNYMKLFAHKNFLSLDGMELLAISLKEKDEINVPILKLLNEYSLIEFDAPCEYFPKTNTLRTLDKEFTYDHLVIASEPIPNLDAIPGFKTACFSPYTTISGLYDMDITEKTVRVLENYRLGNKPKTVLFYNHGDRRQDYFSLLNLALLFEEKIRTSNKEFRELTEIIYITKADSLYPGKDLFDNYLKDLLQQKGIKVLKDTEMIEVDSDHSKIYLKDEKNKRLEMNVGVLIAEPPYELPLHLQKSPFIGPQGNLDFNKQTLIHNEFNNVFCIGSNFHPFQNINSFYEQGTILANNLMLNILNMDRINNKKFKLIEYKNYSNIAIYKGNKKITRLIVENQKEEIKNDGLKGYLWEVYGQPAILKRFMQTNKWFGRYKFLKPCYDFETIS